MAKNEKVIPIEISSSGYTTVQRYTSKHNARPDQLLIAQNTDTFNGVGKLQTAPGYLSSGVSGSGTIYGAHGHMTSAGVGIAVRVINQKIQYHNGTTWTDSGITTLTADQKAELTSFLDRIFIVNGSEIYSSSNGNSWGTTQLTSAPTGAKYIDHFNNRLILADKKSIWWSSLPDLSLNITWNSTSFNVQPDPYDGDFITGIKRFRQRMMIFKNFSIHRLYIYGDLQPEVKPISETTGTPSGRSVIFHDTGMYFFGQTKSGERGIYITDSESVMLISRPVQDLLEAVPSAQLANICAGEHKGVIKWYLGDLTLSDGTVITKCELRYSTYDKAWSWRSLSVAPLIYAALKIGSERNLYFGDSSGQMYLDEYGTTFDGSPINTDILTNWITPLGIDGEGTVRKVFVEGSNVKGLNITFRADERDQWVTCIDTERMRSDLYKGSVDKLKGSKFQMRLTYSGAGPVIEKVVMHLAQDVKQL